MNLDRILLDIEKTDAVMAIVPWLPLPIFFKDCEIRDAYFAPGNDETWGEGNWVKCDRCPDSRGLPSYHHRNFHG